MNLRAFTLVLSLLLVFVLWFLAPSASTQSEEHKTVVPRVAFVPGELLVRFRSEAAAVSAERQFKSAGVEHIASTVSIESLQTDEAIAGLRLLRVLPDATLDIIRALNKRDDVLYAEPNYVRYRLAKPNDPLYWRLWGLHNNGVVLDTSGNVPGIDIDAERAWDITTGSRAVVVGVVDGGIDVNHIDLRENIWRNAAEVPGNSIDDDGNGYVDDVNGFDFYHNRGDVFDSGAYDEETHATHVAGTIGAIGNNSTGVVGVNWNVSLISLKILGRDTEIPPPSTAHLVRAYAYAKRMRDLWLSSNGASGANIRILNNSIGGNGRSQAELDSVRALNSSGILVVAAAGNQGRNNDTFPLYPAGYDVPNVISVAASGWLDTILTFSNFGVRTVALSAPGLSIESTAAFSNYAILSGTSMASPHVAGAAALICSLQPEISVAKLRAALVFNGDVVSSQQLRTISGRRLNAYLSLIAASENDVSPPAAMEDFRIVTRQGRTMTLGWTAPGDDGRSGNASAYDIRFFSSDPSSFAHFEDGTPLPIPKPISGGLLQSFNVDVPLRHESGFIAIRATDNVGNLSPIAVVPISVSEVEANPYVISESPPSTLSSGGVGIVSGDDRIYPEWPLPFPFPFYGHWIHRLNVSTNGALYFEVPPKFVLPPVASSGAVLDWESSVRALQTNMMIAGMWDDYIIDGGVVAVTPDSNRIIFRWEGRTYDSPLEGGGTRGTHTIKFEIELRRDGSIHCRYGEGNEKLFPVVGISGGSPDAYVATSHTSEDAFKSLANANTVTFTPRFNPPISTADLGVSFLAQGIVGSNEDVVSTVAVVTGQTLQYTIRVEDFGPDRADDVAVQVELPLGTSFVSCSTSFGGSCSGSPPGSDGGVVSLNLGRIAETYNSHLLGGFLRMQINAPSGTKLVTRATVSSSSPDLNPTNNIATTEILVAQYSSFNGVVALAADRLQSLALTQDGAVWFWGLNFGAPEAPGYGPLLPTKVPGLSGVVSIATGWRHGLALRSDGTVWAWGVNDVGQLGNETLTESSIYVPPRQVGGLPSIRAIAAGGETSFAIDGEGGVWAWGYGSIGIAGTETSTLPVRLPSLTGVASVTTSGSTAFAVKSDGTVWGWGSNFYGVLGTGTSDAGSATPVRINISNVKSVVTRYLNTIAVKNDGTVWTWGFNGSGELGDGTTNPSNVPIQVTNMSQIVDATTGDASVAIRSDGTVWRWGRGQFTPALIDGINSAIKIVSGAGHYLTLLSDGTVRAWGFGSYGQLGNGGFESTSTPTETRLLNVISPPVAEPGSGTLVFPSSVTLRCDTPGAVIRYTTNGSDPTENDPGLSSEGQVLISSTTVLKMRAFLPGHFPSTVTSAHYTVLTNGSPIDESWFYVRQQYRDFLAREPDQGGWDYWMAQIDECGNNRLCVHQRRIGVSAAFFIELEFQRTGYVVYRMHRAAFGTWPGTTTRANITYSQFVADRALLPEGTNIAQSTISFADAFVLRQQFLLSYPLNQTNAEFVNKLFDTAELIPFIAERQQQIDAMNNSGKTRAQVLLDVIEIADFKTREYSRSFVLMEYFGYLRRDPDQGGYDFWLNVLDNREPENYRGMVCSFITSAEYQQRFGPQVTRFNSECSQ